MTVPTIVGYLLISYLVFVPALLYILSRDTSGDQESY